MIDICNVWWACRSKNHKNCEEKIKIFKDMVTQYGRPPSECQVGYQYFAININEQCAGSNLGLWSFSFVELKEDGSLSEFEHRDQDHNVGFHSEKVSHLIDSSDFSDFIYDLIQKIHIV